MVHFIPVNSLLVEDSRKINAKTFCETGLTIVHMRNTENVFEYDIPDIDF